MIGSVGVFLVATMIVADIALVVTRAKIGRPLRRFGSQAPVWQAWRELVSCPFCFAHWVAFPVALWMCRDLGDAIFLTLALVPGAMAWVGVIGWGLQQVGASGAEGDGNEEA